MTRSSRKIKRLWKKTWHFIWEDDSALSWIVNIILAFVIIKFLVYPGLGLLLNTSHPIVAVVSGSMEHKITEDMFGKNVICGKNFPEIRSVSFDEFWEYCGHWYLDNTDIRKQDFEKYNFKNGFNTGDIMVLKKKDPKEIKVGDVIVYQGKRADPIIHRVVRVYNENGEVYFQTKGDHNPESNKEEERITKEQIIGNSLFKVPFLGWVKIFFVRLINTVSLLF